MWLSLVADPKGWQNGQQNEYFKYNIFSTNLKLLSQIKGNSVNI
jgi:hypothetical protein